MRVYISGPLQGSSDLPTARRLYEQIASVASSQGCIPYVPHLHTDPEAAAHLDAGSVYQRDVAALLASDVVIAHVGAPSTGVGAELALAARAGLAIIAIHRDTEQVSRFAAGLIEEASGHFVTFTGEADLQIKVLHCLWQIEPTVERGRARHRQQLVS